MLPALNFSQRVKSLGNLREISADDDFHRPPASTLGGGSAPRTHSGYSDSDSGHGGDVSMRTRTPVLRHRSGALGHNVQQKMVSVHALRLYSIVCSSVVENSVVTVACV